MTGGSMFATTLSVMVCLSAIGCSAQEDGLCPPTPRNLSELFLTECSEDGKMSKCDSAWNAFASAFRGRDPSTVMAEHYRPYFMELSDGLMENTDNSLFWSRTAELVGLLSCMCATGANVVSSANVPSTTIINNIEKRLGIDELRWCGTTDPSSADGIEYDKRCNCSASFVFFQEFSVLFARAAVGQIFYLGYGENRTFSDTSFFAQYELPNVNSSVGTNATVMVVHRKGVGESCGKGSLVELRRRIEDRGLTYACYDVFGDPRDEAQLPSLTSCAMGIVNSLQQGREPDESSGCFTKENSALSDGHLSISLFIIAALVALASSF